MIITPQVKSLVERIEADPSDTDISKLVSILHDAFSAPDVKERYNAYRTSMPTSLQQYPMENGFAKAYDPLTQEKEFVDTWFKYGIVVGKQVVSKSICEKAILSANDTVRKMSNHTCDLTDSKTYSNIPKDASGTPIISRGFLEVYHNDALTQIRQSVRMYVHHTLIWGQANLWTSYDRLGVKLPNHSESAALGLHVDQNPAIHPDFKTIQGVLALADCPTERGTFVGVPGSIAHFKEYQSQRGDYVGASSELVEKLKPHAQAFPLRAGDLVSWDSRTTHANTDNVSQDIRYVAYVAAGIARLEEELIKQRNDAFASGVGSNVRDALMHASKKPRYTHQQLLESVRTPEKLTKLGRLLYGQEAY